jgi:hypothetical protein
MDGKLRQSVYKKRTAGFQNTCTFRNPSFAPTDVFDLRNTVVKAVLVVFSKIERRVGKDAINGL